MADRRDYPLVYGHPGKPCYDSQSKKWLFARNPGVERHLKPLGDPHFLPGSADNTPSPTTSSPEPQEPQKRARRRVDRLLRENPLYFGDYATLASEERVSESIISATATFDPRQAELLDIGNALDVGAGKTVRIAAMPFGQSGEALRLVRLRKNMHGWGTDRSTWLELHAWDRNTGYWAGNGAPIQQIKFSSTRNKGSLLAVRLPTSIMLFRPFFLQNSVPAAGTGASRYPPSRLYANPVLTIPADDAPFVDVAFNPWYPRQMAAIDERGRWKIWEIAGRKSTSLRQLFSVTLLNSGVLEKQAYAPPVTKRKKKIEDDEDVITSKKRNRKREEALQAILDDTWGRILWVADVNTVVVCNRREIQITPIISESSFIKAPQLTGNQSLERILDIRQMPGEKDLVLVLTSSHVSIMRIKSAQAKLAKGENPGAAVVLSWAHFLDQADVSLCVNIVPETETDFTAVVYSRLNNVVKLFWLSIPEDTSCHVVVSRSDPSSQLLFLNLPDNTSVIRRLMGLTVMSSEYCHSESDDIATDGIGQAYQGNGIRFYEFFALFDDFSAASALHFSAAKRERVEAFQWRKKITVAGNLSGRLIADDDLLADDVELASTRLSRVALGGRKRAASDSIDDNRKISDSWSIPNEAVVAAITAPEPPQPGELNEALQTISDRMQSEIFSLDSSSTLLEILGTSFSIEDIWQASSLFDELINTSPTDLPEENRVHLRPIADGLKFFSDIPLAHETMSSLYGQVINQWLDPLPGSVPLELRLLKESIASRIAVELALASWRIRPREIEPSVSAEQDLHSDTFPGITPGMDFSLPSSSASMPFSSSGPLFTQPSQSSHFLPTPEATPSVVTSSSGASSSTNITLSHLKHHVSIGRPSKTLNQSMATILSHWALGEDPSTYNWEETTNKLSQVEEHEVMTPHQRRKLERKMKRYLKAQRKEAAASASSLENPMILPSSQPQMRRIQSSPVPPGGMEAQTQTQHMPVMASQVEKGRFGGRQAKKKKKRIQGF